MGNPGAVATAAREARSPASLGLPADCRGDPVPAAWRTAVANVAARAVPAHDDGAALLLSLERDGRVEVNQPCLAADGP